MKKEDLIEKYPELVEEIAKEFTCKVLLSDDKKLKQLWEDYLQQTKPENEDFKVLGINLLNNPQLWLSEKTNCFCDLREKDVIEYEKGILIADIFSVKYKNVQFSIGDVVEYENETYDILGFEKNLVKVKSRNKVLYTSINIKDLTKATFLTITEDKENIYYNDKVYWFIFENGKWNYIYYTQLLKTDLKANGTLINNWKIFYNEKNALKFIEENNKQVLFTTEDNIPIYENSKFYTVNPAYKITPVNANKDHKKGFKSEDRKWIPFSSYEAAEQYVLEHAKVLSFDDIKIYLDVFTEDKTILNLVKERLKLNKDGN